MFFGTPNCLPTRWITESGRVKKKKFIQRLEAVSAPTDQERCILKELKVCKMAVTKQLFFVFFFLTVYIDVFVDGLFS